jgi:hypothetical protein
MIIVTARIPKRRLLAGAATALVCCLAAAAAIVFSLAGRAVTTSAEVRGIRTNDDRVAYLASLGWEVEESPLSTEELLIPKEFDESYTDYLALQADQGFDLTQYRGKRVKRYTYTVTNHPSGATDVQAAILVYRNRVIGGQVLSASGAFLHGLAMPETAASLPTGSELV